jgi:cleavage and polyadenylation specificity factor subunit 1
MSAAKHVAVCAEVHPPTGATHCVSAWLTAAAPAGAAAAAAAGATLPDLVVARATALEVFFVRRLPGGAARLELLYRVRLAGVVESLAALPGRAGGRDALLLALRDAKLAVLRWDAGAHALTPTSLHYFEGDEALKAGRAAFPRPPLAVADPRGRCAAVLAFRHQLAVLPAMAPSEEAAAEADALALYGGAAGTGAAAAAAAAPATVGNSYVDNLSAAGVRDVRDAAFLHGADAPALALLHEEGAGWAGSARARRDTAALSVLSLDLAAKRHPVIWAHRGLPTDATRLVAAPGGGVLVLCLTSVLYFAQGIAAGLVLHAAGVPAPAPPLPLAFDPAREEPAATAARYAAAHAGELHPAAAPAALAYCDVSLASWNLELDGASAAWTGPATALLGLRGGALLALELGPRGGGGAALRAARAGAAPPAACMVALAPNLVFLGSLAGDSLLLGVAPRAAAAPAAPAGEPGAKRRRLASGDADRAAAGAPAASGAEGAADGAEGAASDGEGGASEEDEEALYGAALAAPGAAAAPALRVLDSLVGLGPVRWLAAAEGAGAGAAPYALACVGDGPSGALAVLRRSVAADVLTEVPLRGVAGAWALRGADAPGGHDEFLLLAAGAGTRVLATAGALHEAADGAGFRTAVPTIAAGALAGGRRLAQACAGGLRLVGGGAKRQDLAAAAIAGGNKAAALAAADFEGDFALVRLVSGAAALLRLDAATLQLAPVAAAAAALDAGRLVDTCCLHRDSCGWLAAALGEAAAAPGNVYAAVCFADGALELHEAGGDWARPAWATSALPGGARVLAPGAGRAAGRGGAGPPPVVELRLEAFGAPADARPDAGAAASPAPACEAPVLLALTGEHTLLAYKAFAAPGGAGAPRQLRFARLDLRGAPPLLPPAPPAAGAPAGPAPRRMTRFEGLGEQLPHAGVFVAGAAPLWTVAARGALEAHPARPPAPGGAAAAFSPFHVADCPRGFVAAWTPGAPVPPAAGAPPAAPPPAAAAAGLAVCQLPPRLRLDAPWPRQKVATRAAPLRAAFYAEAGLFAVLAARRAPAPAFLPEEPGGEPQASYSYALAAAAARLAGPAAERHELRLLAPGSWAALWRHALAPGEAALAVEPVRLRDNATGATVPLIAVGAGFAAGEDYPCSGRVLLFEVRRAAPPGGPGAPPPRLKPFGGGAAPGAAGWEAELVYSREFKGPVTAVSTVEGYLLVATGNRLETCALASVPPAAGAGAEGVPPAAPTYRLTRSAFHDGPALVTSLAAVKSFVLAGDARHSVQFVQYRDAGRQLALLGRDFGRAQVRAAEFLVAGPSLHVAAADAGGSLRLFTYAPGDPGSWKGQKLAPWGAFHVGDRPGALLRARMPPPAPADRTPRQALLFGTDAGGLGVLAPLALAAPLRRAGAPAAGADGAPPTPAAEAREALRALQAELARCAPRPAGLNPAAFRRRYARATPALGGAEAYGAPLRYATQGVLDGDLLLDFAALPWAAQGAAARRAGLDRAAVLAALSDIARTLVLF